MSHFIDTMAYVGEIPWHRLGTYAGDQNVDGKTMQRLAGMDYRVAKSQVQLADGTLVPDRFALTAKGALVGSAIVSDRYRIFQHDDTFAFCERLRSAAGGALRLHTAGVLKGGTRAWVLAQFEGGISVARRDGTRDVSAPFLLISNSFDGSSCIEIANTSVRVVCWNTLSAALGGAHSGKRSIRHTASAEQQLALAAESLGHAVTYFGAYRETAQNLADTPMSQPAFCTFVAQLLTGKDDEREAMEAVARLEGAAESKMNTQADALIALFRGGKGNGGADRYDALNAVTEYVDHAKARMRAAKSRMSSLGILDKAIDSAAFGAGADLKSRALALLSR